jgi:surface-anchored protein
MTAGPPAHFRHPNERCSMTTAPRRRAALLAMITVGAATVLAPATGATAAEGPAPQPREHRIIAGVHTDAVSTFLDGDRLTLASRADVAEGNGTRFAAGDVRFHLADDARVTVPAGHDFVGPAGSQAWIAPESNPGPGRLWPGFSTESVPAGAVEADRTTFTLTGLDGPGSLELFTAAGFGGTKRLWSSDEDGFTAFTVGRTHMHANWAFTAAGTYRIGVESAVTTGGRRQTAQATYTFVVGGLPAATATTTALTASATAVVAGGRVTLDATVTPADAAGWVEFLDGDGVLGHVAPAGGRARFETTALPLGNRSLSARFVPHVRNDLAPSASAPAVVTVTETAGGEVFGVGGLAARYAAGEQIDLRPVGATLREGDRWRWLIRAAGQSTVYAAGDSGHFRRDATVALDGAEIRVQIRDAANKAVQESAWRTLNVTGPNPGTGEPVTVTGLRDSYHAGDPARATVGHRPLTDGETGRWVSRYVPSSVAWEPVPEWGLPQPVPGSPGTYSIDTGWLNQSEWAYEIVGADGTVVGRSPAFLAEIRNRELQLSGLRTVYRAGDTLRAGSELHPARDGVAHEWSIADEIAFTPIPGATSASLELPVTAELDGRTLYLTTTDATTGHLIASAQRQLRVTGAAPGEQLLFLDSLAGHYHQGGTVRLSASADPPAGDTDTYRWLWKRPDQAGFTEIDDVVTPAHEVRAEQALDGTLVKAELRTAAGELLATSEPSTIHVDDHGAAPQQKVTVTGLADSYRVGEDVRLTAAVAPASVLSRWEWHIQRRGQDAPEPVAGQHGASLSLAATADLDGAAVSARLTFDDGRRYVESAAVTLHVDGSGGPGVPALSVSGLAAGGYRPGDAVTLQAVQSPQGPLTGYQWFARRPGADGFTPVGGETGAAYGFTATGELDGAEFLVKLYDGRTVVAVSAAVVLRVRSGQPGGGAAKSVTATISESGGALVISVDPGDRAVVLPPAVLSASGDRWESSGALRPVTVTDTRAGRPGWTVSGQIADGFRAADGSSFTGGHLGWTPGVTRQGAGQGVVAGPVAVPYVAGQPHTGLGGGAALASAPGGAGRGTAELDAALRLSVPTGTAAGVYTGTLTLTAI